MSKKPAQGQLLAVKVYSIILDLDHERAAEFGYWDGLGTIFYKSIDDIVVDPEKSIDIKSLSWARPLFPHLKYYPLKGEVVLIVETTSKNWYADRDLGITYYMPNVNIWNHQHHNALPPPDGYEAEGSLGTDFIYNKAFGGLVRHVSDGETDIPLGKYFKEKLNIKPLLPYEGDHIIEGRFGNSIRLGATARHSSIPTENTNDWSDVGDLSDPIVIIRNGQSEDLDMEGWVPTIEDINRDNSSIYLTSNQKISNLEIASPNWDSWSAKFEAIVDPITMLTNPPITHEPIEPIIPEKDELANIPQQDTTPPNMPPSEDDIEEEDDTTVTPKDVPESKEDEKEDELSIYDQLIDSGDYDEDDFIEYEIEEVTENQVILPTTSITLPSSYDVTALKESIDIDEMIGEYYQLKHLIHSDTSNARGINNLPGIDEGRSTSMIVQNLKNLMINVGDKIKKRFPKMYLTSGFRCNALESALGNGTGGVHRLGRAIDFKVSGEYTSTVFNWITKNIPQWNQMIWEFPEKSAGGNKSGGWIHISYNAAGNRKRTTLASESKKIHDKYGGTVRKGIYQDGIETAYQNYV